MEFYKYDSNKIYCGTTEGTWDPLAKRLKAPGSSTHIKPPEAPEKMIPHWSGTEWELVADVYAEQAELQANMDKLRNSDELGIARFKMDIHGEVTLKTKVELAYDRNIYKRARASQHIGEILQSNLLHIIKKLSRQDPSVVDYIDKIDTIYRSINGETEIESILWPVMKHT